MVWYLGDNGCQKKSGGPVGSGVTFTGFVDAALDEEVGDNLVQRKPANLEKAMTV